MQSQLEAALLGHTSVTNVSSAIVEDDKDFQEDEADDDFIDEDCDADAPKNGRHTSTVSTGKTITLQMLLAAGILQPASGSMSIEYLGQKFVGDLLEDGKIRSQETDIVFASPSAWAIACKRFINPDKKSGCGWASVKYKGKKLDAYKNIWYKRKKEFDKQEKDYYQALEDYKESEREFAEQVRVLPMIMQRIVVKHNTIANRTFTHDANTMIECVSFSNLGKIQPFLVSLSTNAALLMDFHCHLTKTEVSGYLAGHWDVNAHNLQITHAFPCRNTKSDRENASQVEAEISKAIDRENLILVGWYHSHPFSPAAPTLRDIDAQLDYQIRMKGTLDNSYTPCIGIIISPYYYENTSLESSIIAYWVIPPPEAKPNEYGRPMLMSYSVVQDATLTANIKNEMQKCADYYKKEMEYINFCDNYTTNTTYRDKLKSTLSSKFPRDTTETNLWGFIKDIIGGSKEENDSVLSIPCISKSSQFLSGLSSGNNMNSNLILTPDIASVLFNSGKFPSASSLLGLPDPMAHSTLAANNMFLQSNLFKMQDLLKPLSTSSPHQKIPTPLKIPSDIKGSKQDYSSKLDFATPETSRGSPKSDFSATDLSISNSKTKQDFTASDLSGLSNKSQLSEFSLDLSAAKGEEKPSKFAKSDYSAYDLSSTASNSFALGDGNSGGVTSDTERCPSEGISEQERDLDLASE